MNCIEFRQLLLSDPYHLPLAATEHRDDCSGCTQFENEILALDSELYTAMSIEVPQGLSDRVQLNHSLQPILRRPTPRVWLGLVASFIGVVFVVAAVINPFNDETNTNELVNAEHKTMDKSTYLLTHVEHIPAEFYQAAHTPLSNADIEEVLESIGAESQLENVVYASICPVGDGTAAHLVVKNGQEQYTIMVIPDKAIGERYEISNDSWRGYVTPHGDGALAVMTSFDQPHAIANLDAFGKQYEAAIFHTAGL